MGHVSRGRWRRASPLLAVLALLAGIRQADAHPHVWVQARSTVELDAGMHLTGLEQTWTFDPEYSAFATLNLDTAGDGKPAPDKLAALAKTQLASLAEYKYFTHAKVNGKKVTFGAPTGAKLTFADGRLTLTFLLPVAQPPVLKVASFDTYDETFFVAFNVVHTPDAIRVAGPVKGCALNVMRPKLDAKEGEQIIPDSQAAVLAKAAQVGTDFRTHVIVACPSAERTPM